MFFDSKLFNSQDRGAVIEDITSIANDWSGKELNFVEWSSVYQNQMTNKVKGSLALMGCIPSHLFITWSSSRIYYCFCVLA